MLTITKATVVDDDDLEVLSGLLTNLLRYVERRAAEGYGSEDCRDRANHLIGDWLSGKHNQG